MHQAWIKNYIRWRALYLDKSHLNTRRTLWLHSALAKCRTMSSSQQRWRCFWMASLHYRRSGAAQPHVWCNELDSQASLTGWAQTTLSICEPESANNKRNVFIKWPHADVWRKYKEEHVRWVPDTPQSERARTGSDNKNVSKGIPPAPTDCF